MQYPSVHSPALYKHKLNSYKEDVNLISSIVIQKMIPLTYIHIFSLLYLVCVAAVAFGNTVSVLRSSPTQPAFDPLLSEFVWFSSHTSPEEEDSNPFASLVNIEPVMLPAAVDPLTAWARTVKKHQKLQKIAIRL